MWPTVYWLHWLLFVMLFVVFILDADGINSGFTTCSNDFEMSNAGDTIKIWNIPAGYDCSLSPFIYTVLVDLLCTITAYTVHRVAGLYVARSKEKANARSESNFDAQRKSTISVPNTPKQQNSVISDGEMDSLGEKSPPPKIIMAQSPSLNPFDD